MANIRPERRQRRRHRRLRRGRRHARQRTGAEGHQGGDPRSRRRGTRSQDFVNDEWASFAQLAWKDMRTTSGNWRVHNDFPNLPAWIVKSVGGTTIALGGRLAALPGARVQGAQHLTARSPGANLLDWPMTLAEMEPYYAKAEDKMGVTGTNGIPRLPGNNNFKVLEAGADEARLQGSPYRQHGDQQPSRAPAAAPASRSASASRAASRAPNGRRSTPRSRQGEATGNLEVRPNAMVGEDRARCTGKVTGVVYADGATAARSGRRPASSRWRATRSRARAYC